MKDFNEDLIKKVLYSILPLPTPLGVTITEESEVEFNDLEYLLQEINYVDPEATISYGMSKMAIISPNFHGVVIKIPFEGTYYETYNEETGLCDVSFVSFLYAPTDNTFGDDYCKTELEKYINLCDFDLQEFVAETLLYDTYNGTNIYLQEEVTPVLNIYLPPQKPSIQSREIANQWYSNSKIGSNVDWFASCIDRYNREKVEDFLSYCSNVDNTILEDIHGGNIGYRVSDDSPCILDYSGFSD